MKKILVPTDFSPNANKANDEKAVKALKKEGWKVITVWECALKHVKQEKTLNRILEKLRY